MKALTTVTYASFLQALSVDPVAAKSVPSLSTSLNAWREQRRRAREDREMWAIAQEDPRLMTDLVCALRRAE